MNDILNQNLTQWPDFLNIEEIVRRCFPDDEDSQKQLLIALAKDVRNKILKVENREDMLIIDSNDSADHPILDVICKSPVMAHRDKLYEYMEIKFNLPLPSTHPLYPLMLWFSDSERTNSGSDAELGKGGATNRRSLLEVVRRKSELFLNHFGNL